MTMNIKILISGCFFIFSLNPIYKIINIITGDFYIGSSLNLMNRYKNHINKLNKQNHRNNILNRAWKKYGSKSFVFVVIDCLRSNNERR